MVSKTVICVFAALCCAQAFVSAAPHEELETQQLGSTIKCMKKMAGAITLIKDSKEIFFAYKKIFDDAKASKAACAAKDGATDEEIAACRKAANSAEQDALIAETGVLGQKALADWNIVAGIIQECFSA